MTIMNMTTIMIMTTTAVLAVAVMFMGKTIPWNADASGKSPRLETLGIPQGVHVRCAAVKNARYKSVFAKGTHGSTRILHGSLLRS
jgi:hypothetical protein